jgi:prepilin-type N-terminal cleavage/methylation domain-containing protein/prepilin-type processing-associated H-X9-DG protein
MAYRYRSHCYAAGRNNGAAGIPSRREHTNRMERGGKGFPPCTRCAFTLIELLVVIAIISLLVSILLPSLQKAKDLAKSMVCMMNQRNIGLGCMQYASDYNGVMYAAYTGPNGITPSSWPDKWQQAMGYLQYLPWTALFMGEQQDINTQDMWNCPVAKEMSGKPVVSWTYLRVLNSTWMFWDPSGSSAGTAGWCKLDEIEQPTEQIFVIDGVFAVSTPSGPELGQMIGDMAHYNLIANWEAYYSGNTDTAGFIHDDRANVLMSDWHVESLYVDNVTLDMCDDPNPL